MAINPNTDFSSGAVLTAAQQNRFPRGIMAYTAITTSDATITVEEVQIGPTTFTAVANRYYRITYYEPYLSSTASTVFTMRIRLGTTTAGTQIQNANVINANGSIFFGTEGICIAVTTFSAGTVNLVGTLQSSAGTGNASGGGPPTRFLLVEDIGPA
jgi:hypothetical protein